MKRVLLVDAKIEVRGELEKVLQAGGYETVSAANGAEALEMALIHPPDMVIADILVPVMDGYTLCREWRKSDVLKTIPFVFHTATYTDPQDEEFALSLGADRYFTKTGESNDFLKLVHEAFAGHKSKVLRPPPDLQPGEKVLLKEYNEVLVRRLEERMVQVDEAEKNMREQNAILKRNLDHLTQAENTVRADEAHLFDALKIAHLGHWEFDIDKDLFLFNDTLYSMFHTTAGQQGGYTMSARQYVQRFVYPDDAPRVTALIQQYNASVDLTLTDLQLEHRIKYADGGTGCITVRIVFVRDEQGRVKKTYGINQDITERKRAEEVLNEETARRRILFEQSPDGMLVLDPDTGGFIEFNAAAHQQLGYSREEFARLRIADLEANETPEETRKSIAAAMSKGRIDFETLQRTKQGELRNVLVTAQAIDVLGHSVYQCIWRDMTDRKRSERVLQESEERYRSLFEHMVGGYAYCKMIFENGQPHDFVYLKTNAAFDELTGLKNVEGKKASEVIPGIRESDPDLLKRYGRVALTGKPERFEVFVESLKDWYSISLYSPEKEYFVAVFDVVTKRKLAEEHLSVSEARYRRLFESAKDGILILDAESGRVVEVNPSLITLIGYSHEDLAGKEIWQIGLLKNIASFIEALVELEKKDSVHIEDMPLKAKDGKFIHAEFIGNVYLVDSRKIIQCNFRDIADRKRTDEKLRLQSTAIQSAASAIVITDRSGAVISANRAFSELTGYSEEEIVGSNPRMLKSGKHPAPFYQKLWETICSGEVWKGEIENRRKDGSLYMEEMTITPVRQAGGEISHFIAIKQDVTEQKKLQSRLLQSQKVQSLGTLAGGIAHDFNNILGIILIYSSALERGLEDKRKVMESSAAISKTVARGAGLVRQILTFARQTDVSFRAMNVPDFIRELVTMLQETFPKVVEIEHYVDQTVPFISADYTQMHQALLNLCVNARDAMPNGGKITIRVESVAQAAVRKRFMAASNARYVCLSVSDTGCGIDEKTRSRIFDPFFTTKEAGKGTGLGLSVVYGVMQTHHGFVDVESEVNQGTKFTLFVPVPDAGTTGLEKVESVDFETAGGSETILVVEDEELLREILQALLESKGYRVLAASDGYEAVDIYKKHRSEIAIVLTDVGLPKMTGIDEFKKLRHIDPQVKVILASGFLEPDTKSEMLKAGAKAFIQKPYRLEDVLKKVRDVLDAK